MRKRAVRVAVVGEVVSYCGRLLRLVFRRWAVALRRAAWATEAAWPATTTLRTTGAVWPTRTAAHDFVELLALLGGEEGFELFLEVSFDGIELGLLFGSNAESFAQERGQDGTELRRSEAGALWAIFGAFTRWGATSFLARKWTAGTATDAARALRAQFFTGKRAVTIAVERSEALGGLHDFVGRERAVAISVECFDEGIRGRWATAAGRTGAVWRRGVAGSNRWRSGGRLRVEREDASGDQ